MEGKKHYIVLITAIMLLVVSCVPENEFENKMMVERKTVGKEDNEK